MWADRHPVSDNASSMVGNSKTVVEPITLKGRLLPAPYETDCFDYRKVGFKSKIECKLECFKSHIYDKFGYLPPNIIIQNETDQEIFYADDTEIYREFASVEKHCDDFDCRRKNCVVLTTMTKITLDSASQFTIYYTIPYAAWTTVSSRPVLSLVEFLTYIMSAVGTYTGLSFMSFEPSKVFRTAKSVVAGKAETQRTSKKTSPATCRSCEACHQSLLVILRHLRRRSWSRSAWKQ